jgi:hypothetical protein
MIKNMTQIKVLKTLFVLLISLTMIACSKSDYKVKVKYINLTGTELKTLKIGGQRIGKLKNNQETDYIPYKEYGFDSGMPNESIEAKIDNKKTHDYSEFYDCGTQKYSVQEGTFEIEIHKIVIEDKIYLRLENK